ncbi:hypothetical protein [Neptunicoccus sediminis]|uniref:hypothetical protein n=1 Tax=Neptunicoccus sediminis TaxID=1892596 RepID=UPI0008462353|nr:hypothetical protein [Neptunicoccus sediminis]
MKKILMTAATAAMVMSGAVAPAYAEEKMGLVDPFTKEECVEVVEAVAEYDSLWSWEKKKILPHVEKMFIQSMTNKDKKTDRDLSPKEIVFYVFAGEEYPERFDQFILNVSGAVTVSMLEDEEIGGMAVFAGVMISGIIKKTQPELLVKIEDCKNT